MTDMPLASRRAVLRTLAGAPFIPIVGFATPFALGGVAARAADAAPKSVEFVGMAAPDTPAAQATTTVESGLVVSYADGARQTFRLGYQPLFFTGDQVPRSRPGRPISCR
jgi:hypothetical protein